jgi:hypothetical protein
LNNLSLRDWVCPTWLTANWCALVKEIERDLVRWNRGKWMAAVGFAFVLQVAGVIWGSKTGETEVVYPREPKVGFAEARDEVVELENPFLFASANWNGFSGEAWLRKPAWEPPAPLRRVPARFLRFEEAREIGEDAVEENVAFVEGRKPRAVFPPPPEVEQPEGRRAELKVEGFGERRLKGSVELPEQYHNDVLTSSVVEALVGRDGLVISARVIEGSGSAKADGDALALAKRAVFAPVKNGEAEPQTGKLIFEWFALDLSRTNNVKR